MRVVIFHYHLNPGGVTRIIESQVEALLGIDPKIQITILTGYAENLGFYNKPGVQLVVNEVLNYLTSTSNLEEKLQLIKRVLQENLHAGDILHFHNLNLGKNPLVTLAVNDFVQEGYKLINHAHDFSEDRPKNQQFLEEIISNHFKRSLIEVMYPANENYSFAVLNSFDLNRLKKFGIHDVRLLLLPNPVVFNENLPGGRMEEWREEICLNLNIDPEKQLITYPVRVIKRKNIGEFILMATLFTDEAAWIVTQPPKNPIEVEIYEKWKAFTEAQGIFIAWEAGTKVDFEKLLRVSDFCFTTSVQEGFGMVFMEPWLLNTPVVGRNIPMVTDDMKEAGIEFTCLYNKFFVDDKKEMYELSMEEQMKIIKKAHTDQSFRQQLLSMNSVIKKVLNKPDNSAIARNKEVILNTFSLSNYGNKLHGAYKRLVK